MKLSLYCLVALQLLAATSFSQTGADPYKNGINPPGSPPAATKGHADVLSFEEEVISLPLRDAFELLKKFPDDPARYAEALKQVAADKAKVERMVTLRGVSGQRTNYQSIVEFRYATEYGGDPAAKDTNSRIVPTAFETRNIGDVVELHVALESDGETVSGEINRSKIRLLSNRDFGNDIEQPIFQSQQIQTSISLKLGKPFLLGTLNPPHDDGFSNSNEQRVWLDFITFHKIKEKDPGSTAQASGAETKEMAGAFVTVVGEVKTPQRVPFSPNLGLVEAIHAAGGFSEFANRKKVIWISEGKRAVVDATIILKDPSQEVILKPRDQIEVGSSPF